MASNYVLESTGISADTRELVFAGDNVRLSGQIDYPNVKPASGVYPLLFVLPHAGCNTRHTFKHYADLALQTGFAVFRWDKRGTGRSGAGGRGSTTQDTANAYEIAIEQPHIDVNNVVILAQGEGSVLLGKSFGLFARIQRPKGVILVGNMLDAKTISAIDTPLQIVHGADDWLDPNVYGKKASEAHNKSYNYNSSHFIAVKANRMLITQPDETQMFHVGAKQVMQDWLLSL